MDETNKNRKKRFSTGEKILIVILFIVLILCEYKVIQYIAGLIKTDSEYSRISDAVVEHKEEEENENNREEEEEEDETSWKTVRIDFDALQKINDEVVGWIAFDNTDVIKIDYPILYSEDDDLKYLHRDIYGNYSYQGCIFLDSLNSADFSDPYNIIYGHNMNSGSMFGTLKKYRNDSSIYEDNQYFTIYTPSAAYRYRIFAYFTTTSASFVYQIGYTHDEIYEEFLENVVSDSARDTGISVTPEDDVVALSTCTSRQGHKNERFVVFAKAVDFLEY